MSPFDELLKAAFEAGKAAGRYDRWCDSPDAPPPPPAPDYDEWRKELAR